MRIETWGIYRRNDGRNIGYATYRYASGRLVLKWQVFSDKYASKYDCTKEWHKPCVTQVLFNSIDVANEVEASALLELVD